MNSTTPNTTGSVAITAGMISTVILWVCSLAHIPAPPDAVAAALAALVMYAAHQVGVMLNRPAAPVAAPAPAAPPAPPAQ